MGRGEDWVGEWSGTLIDEGGGWEDAGRNGMIWRVRGCGILGLHERREGSRIDEIDEMNEGKR